MTTGIRAAPAEAAAPAAQVEIRHLRAFAAVAEELHFTRAAARLHLGQQAVSAQVRQLEAVMGVELFRRTTRSVELTRSGERLNAGVGRVLGELDALVGDVRHTAAGLSGRLVIGYTQTMAPSILPAILARVRAKFPS